MNVPLSREMTWLVVTAAMRDGAGHRAGAAPGDPVGGVERGVVLRPGGQRPPLVRSYVLQWMRMLAVTWANDG